MQQRASRSSDVAAPGCLCCCETQADIDRATQGGDIFGAKASEILAAVRGKDFRCGVPVVAKGMRGSAGPGVRAIIEWMVDFGRRLTG